MNKRDLEDISEGNPNVNYHSVDPAPPAEETEIPTLREHLLDTTRPLFKRYRAMFALRNLSSEAAVGLSICIGI
jgi:deoxyhypusine monooxygenase